MFMIEKGNAHFDWFRGHFIESEKPLKEQHTRHFMSVKAALRTMLRFEDIDFIGAKIVCANF